MEQLKMPSKGMEMRIQIQVQTTASYIFVLLLAISYGDVCASDMTLVPRQGQVIIIAAISLVLLSPWTHSADGAVDLAGIAQSSDTFR